MRLYRGLKNPYRPDLVVTSRLASGTDFTDCPATALLYAQGARGVLLVVDIDTNEKTSLRARVTKELWLDAEAERFMLWGRFDDRITAIFSAKDLRTRLRRERPRNAAHAAKSYALRAIIDDELRSRSLRAKLAERSEMFDRASSHE
ncbi:MAG TPA: hypothetical protein VMU96_04715 [Casimicrobiaceae bacterium]|nr:hypothetical protein [Casimicrobiaceae bacterium]